MVHIRKKSSSETVINYLHFRKKKINLWTCKYRVQACHRTKYNLSLEALKRKDLLVRVQFRNQNGQNWDTTIGSQSAKENDLLRGRTQSVNTSCRSLKIRQTMRTRVNYSNDEIADNKKYLIESMYLT